ncbi:MAG: DMT family transporter [Deltaproteobacteria bacterium]
MPLITGLASAVLFGAATPASKALLAGIDAQVLAGLLYLGAACGVLPLLVGKKSFGQPWHADRRTLLLLTGAIILGGVLGPFLLLLGLTIATSGSVSLWLNLEFVATVVLGHFVFHEHLTARGWIAAGGTLIAAVLLAWGEGTFGILSVSLVASACLCWGFDNHFTALIDGLTPAQITMWKSLAAGIFNLAIGVMRSGEVAGVTMICAALIVGAFCYGVSVTLYITTAQGLGASRSQMIFSSAPFFGLLLSAVLLGEHFTKIQALAAGIIMLSLIFLFSERHSHVHRHDSVYHIHGHSHTDGHHDHDHNGIPLKESHSHWHEHEKTDHEHKHWPDLHHRHDHTNDE